MTTETKKTPSHRAYQVRNFGENNAQSYWTAIGSVFQHKDGNGFDVLLDALPRDGRVVIRPITEKKEETNS